MSPATDSLLRFVGIDVGSTTSSMMVARARLVRNCVTGRNELGDVEPLFRPSPVFTPFNGDDLDITALESLIDRWIAEAGLDLEAVASGGALVTGLAARAENATRVTQLVKQRFRQAIVATADDPCLESWLAFIGNSLGLSRAEPQRPFINLDIGGGTTNIAWGQAGQVRRCGCYYVGARHVQVEPGTYHVRRLSEFGRDVLLALGIPSHAGYELTDRDIAKWCNFSVGLLTNVVGGRSQVADDQLARRLCQAEFAPPADAGNEDPVITFSGGVGELAYRCARGEPLPGTTEFGDLGIDLARALCASPALGRDLTSHVPSGMGRATVHGLTIHSTEIAGATLYLPRPELLPLSDLPILGTISDSMGDDEWRALLGLAARAGAGACLRVDQPIAETASVKRIGQRLAAILESVKPSHPLVLLTAGNIGKTLGQYATRWGALPVTLVVIDEIPDRPAHFATIGKPSAGLVPVSFHGIDANWDPVV
ncbi:MAG: ethanolamine ammonia-lyase reactivating factor EutA [Planctomycetia bacterium]|nr:ethanolamine ammonia-lyase reactivating factor EutA [Planctomycetia bacterium]